MSETSENTILIVGGSEEICDLFKDLLEHHRGDKVDWSPNGQSGLDYLNHQSPDLVFVHLTLADMTPMEFYQQAQHQIALVPPLIIMGSDPTDTVYPTLQSQGIAGYLDLSRALSDLFIARDTALQKGTYYPTMLFPPGFPNEDPERDWFYDTWFAKHLEMLEETSLSQWAQKTHALEIYRFTCLPDFSAPLTIRLWASGKELGNFQAAAKLGTGRGGYEAGPIAEETGWQVNNTDWKALKTALVQTRFWVAPSWMRGLDPEGENWIFEGWLDGRYKILRTYSPKSTPAFTLSSAFIQLLPTPFARRVNRAWIKDVNPALSPAPKKWSRLGYLLPEPPASADQA